MKSKKILAITFTILAVLLMGAFVPFLIIANDEVKAEVLDAKITRCTHSSYIYADFEIKFKTNHKCNLNIVINVYDSQTDTSPSTHYVRDLTIEKSNNYLHNEIDNRAYGYYSNYDIEQMRVEAEITKLERVNTTAEHLGFMLPALSVLFAGFAIYAFVDLKKANAL